MTKSKKLLSIFIAVLMAISMMPFTASAASEPYLTFAGTDSFSIKTNNSKRNWNGTLEYSTDASTWTTWNGTSQISSDNNVLYLRGTGNTQITGNSISKNWVITTQGTVACSGDIRTLLDYDEPESSSMGNYCFYYLFRNCTSLTAAPELPATMLTQYCYYSMFNGCTSLTTAPELPATALAQYCYSYMFAGCTSLTTAPELPATTLAQYCYYSMFNGCTSLTTAPELPATSLARSCYLNMFNYCTSLTTPPELPATTLESNCYNSMFYDCKSLTTAPELPATDLAQYCYVSMFNGCTSLTTPPELPATDLADGCYQYMFRDCTGIKLSTEQTAEYSIPYSIPKEGTGSMGTDALDKMFTGTGGTFRGTPTINTTYYIPAPAAAEPNNGTNITVADTISENFYLDGDYYGADAYVTVNYNHNSNLSQTANFNTDDPQKLSEMDKISSGDYAGNSIISVIQAPAQSTEPITINVYASQADAEAGTNPVDTITYSVYSYCREIIEGTYEDDVKDLARATLDYAAAAQNYFEYNQSNMATKDNASNAYYGDVASVDMASVTASASAPSSIEAFSVVVKSDLEINLLSRTPINVESASIDTTGTSRFAAENTTNGDWYVVHISGIEPANMDNTFTVVTDKGNIVMSANAIMKLMANSSDEKMVTLAKAMYLYGAAANAYFD